MKSRFAVFAGCLMVALAGLASSAYGQEAKSDAKAEKDSPKIVGKWIVVGEAILPEGSNIEFTKENKVVLNLNVNDKIVATPIGTYKVEGDKLHLMAKKNGVEDNETNTIKSLTADEMVLVDPKGKEEKLKRVK